MRLAYLIVPAALLVFAACSDAGDPSGPESDSSPVATSDTPAGDATQQPTAVVREPTTLPDPETRSFEPTGTADGPAEHDAARALEHVRVLSREPRVSGTPGELRAVDYIVEQFRSYGYVTEVREFDFDGDRFKAGEVTVGGQTIESLTMAGSPGGGVEAAAAYIGLADEAGIAGQDLTGKIAVADRGDLNFSVKYENARAAGAIGLIIVNHEPGIFSGNLTLAAAFPVVSVSQEEGQAIIAAAKSGDVVGIESPPTVGMTRSMNVVAKASPETRCTIVVGGHFDSVPTAPGANDNASGTANVLEVARAAAVDGLDEGVCFVTFGAEESGLFGSRQFVADMDEQGTLPSYMINLDVTGIGNGVEVIGDSAFADRAHAAVKAAGIPVVGGTLPANSGSDHQSFGEAGVEVVFFTSGEFSTIHSPEDVFEDIETEVHDMIGDSALIALQLAMAEVAPQ